MFRSRFSHTPDRRGVILLVVLTLLALFAVIGLSFALYAEQEATAARIARESVDRIDAQDKFGPNGAGYEAAKLAMAQMLFDVADPQSASDPAAYSGLRGHSFARAMYGWNSQQPLVDNLSPYAGLGRFPVGTPVTAGSITADLHDVINYSLAPDGTYVIDPERDMPRMGANAMTLPLSGTYRNVAAPYTYPDLKDFYLAVQEASNPSTPGSTSGRILQPSFFRTWGKFNQATLGPNGSLAPPTATTNQDWTNSQGRLYTVRPRPFDHTFNGTTEFPYPTPNADGSFTGDVQNLPNPQGIQHNDSIWIYPGGPIINFNNKQYTACIAPLILDLSGRVNLSVAGNLKGGTTSVSSSGIGPSEINPTKVLNLAGGDPNLALQQLLNGNTFNGQAISGKYGSMATNPPLDRITQYMHTQFNGPTATQLMGRIPPFYSRVDYDAVSTSGMGMGMDRMSPIGSGTSPFPTFQNTRYYDSTNQSAELNNHPAQYRPDYWSANWESTAAVPNPGRSFTPAELQWLYGEYGDTFNEYAKADVVKLAPSHLGAAAYDSGSNPNPSQVVNDPANLVRMLTTTHSSDISRPEVATFNTTSGNVARLGSIDLNRNLTDYRDDTARDYTPDNINQDVDMATMTTNAFDAKQDRQEFARDIFSRLVATYNINAEPTTPLLDGTLVQYDDTNLYPKSLNAFANEMLRTLAQLAVNIVDYIDNDDVNTVFVWNPYDTSNTYFNPLTPAPASVTDFTQNIVVGVEQPRLVINEAYASLVNNRNDTMAPAAEPLETRFWLELFNPLNDDSSLSESGAARLHYRQGTSPNTTMLAQSYSPYQVQIIDTGATPNAVSDELRNAANVLGTTATSPTIVIGNVGQPDYVFDPAESMKANGTIYSMATMSETDEAFLVHPSNGTLMGPQGQNQGYYVLGPRDDHPAGGVNATLRLPDPTGPGMNLPTMTIPEFGGNNPTDANRTSQKDKTYTTILRRLANPYIAPQNNASAANYNPYVTVDYLANIKPRDRVQVLQDPMFMPADEPNPSEGKVHPFASIPVQVEPQSDGMMTDLYNTFFAFNKGGNAPLASLKWLVHKDRSLLNTLELLSVSAFGPAQLTNHFNVDPTFTQNYNAHTAEQVFAPGLQNGGGAFQAYDPMAMPAPTYGLGSTTPIFTQVGQMFKALDLLQVGPHQSGMAVGGRTHGKININMAGHRAVLEALLDANINANYFSDPDVQAMWTSLTQGGLERTFFPPKGVVLPAPPQEYEPVNGLIGANATTLPEQLQKTLLRNDGMEYSFYIPTASRPGPMMNDPTQPGIITEPLAKMWNNTTTTSNNFLVIMTVGFFEVREVDATTGRVYLGKEFYEEYPGDTRSKFISYVDRTNLAVDTTNTTEQYNETPWFTKLTKNVQPIDTTIEVEAGLGIATGAYPGQPVVYVDGKEVPLLGKQILIGYGRTNFNGGDGELVTINSGTGANGIATLQVTRSTTPPANFHPAGSPVSNALLGNPGPQPNYNPEDDRYKNTVTPFFSRVER